MWVANLESCTIWRNIWQYKNEDLPQAYEVEIMLTGWDKPGVDDFLTVYTGWDNPVWVALVNCFFTPVTIWNSLN